MKKKYDHFQVVTGTKDPLPTLTGEKALVLKIERRVPGLAVMWLVAPVSMYHGLALGSWSAMVLNA